MAQQARPKVIGHKEPARAQFTTLSSCVRIKPFSATASLTPFHRSSTSPVAGSVVCTDVMVPPSLPIQRPLPPFIYEADGQNCQENHHRPEAEQADIAE